MAVRAVVTERFMRCFVYQFILRGYIILNRYKSQ